MVTRAAVRAVTSGLEFPEGPVALEDGTLLVGEMAAGRITRIAPDGTKSTLAETGGGPNGLALGPDGCLYVCNNGGQNWTRENGQLVALGQADAYAGGRIEKIDLATGQVSVLYDRGPSGPLRGPNDIVFDRDGGLWFTDMGKRRKRDMDYGGIYYASVDGAQIREIVYPMMQPNGIALSPDESRLYVAETNTARVWSFDLVEPGEIAPAQRHARGIEQLLIGLPGYQLLDSMAIDAQGNVCIATMINGGITVVSPRGHLVEHIAMPDPFTTNICFGGPDMRTAFVTLSGTGVLAAFEWPRQGLELNFQNRSLSMATQPRTKEQVRR
ncbi:SMP-30/gluconolactonase/LRE family protein [Mesorhizobium sp. BE184]|uniref:SMP-30/gluconolactonase/LRE family protein n=1 Tax=Mesorhizobium sp. BE184 TaxID=2817714 RepID=UPI002867AEB1|nr:SMP-30/gluconolactonase/LRE family protein [Mesorhizobium sp. BE184]MDR7033156.1 gluconolactonase [Mesorhizobium sp. BE184]